MNVLILSSTDDPHASGVAKHLKEFGDAVTFFRYDEFITQCQLEYSLIGSQRVTQISRGDELLDLSKFASIWYRRPGQLMAGQFPEDWIGRMVESESRIALEGVLYSQNCLWVNHPHSDQNCLHKLRQLDYAQQLGFQIPKTLVTNRPELVEKFFDDCSGRVIYKLIGETSNFAVPASESPRGVSTLVLRKQDLKYIDQVRHSPHIFQQQIPKAFEVRVTVVGQKLFCIKIDSQSGKGQVDWRNDYSVAMDPFELPEVIKDLCMGLMRKFELNYGAFDLIVTPDGDFVFLELNCAGQYLWIEEKTDFKISYEIANLLSGRSEPLIPARS